MFFTLLRLQYHINQYDTTVEFFLGETNPGINWADDAFEAAAEEAAIRELGKEAGYTITSAEAATIKTLDLLGSKDIAKLDDLKHFPALETLILSNTILPKDFYETIVNE